MTSLAEHYARAFGPDRFFGLDMVINWIALVIIVWIIGLSYLVLKSDSTNLQTRFVSILLFFEGLKGLWQASNIVPYSFEFQQIWDVVWILKIDVFMIANITAVILYLLFPVYFRINALKFMFNEKVQRFAWWIAPIIGVITWILIKDTPPFILENASWLSCSAVGVEPVLHVWYGQITAEAENIRSSIGPCPAVFDSLVSDQRLALWFLTLIGTPISIIALIFIRITLKQGDIDGEYVIPKPFYTGFLGKVIANTIFFSTIVIFMPLINGGPAGFLAVLEWRYIDRSIMANVKYFIWTLNLGLPILAVGFEAMMFVYASTKDTVLGIDERLRKTFTNTIFTGVGAISFIAASEIMENLLGFGLIGGVVLGVGLFVARKPVIGILDGMSHRLIPSEFSKQEEEYLKLYAESISDGEITGNERVLLKTLATAYGITDQRIEEIEGSLSRPDTEISSEPNVILLTEIPQQWTDDSGYSWRKFSDGTIQWWNGTEWQEYM
ncbi:MAG: hypothetical protein DBX05_01585 [Candidatus Poseidoniales archaeon]|nr:MAG: hypothetical protein CBE15_03070 [Euryarchaeota archaeon TMED255]RAH10155.1 MAG: hypothetical protein CMA23_004325 [Euryarchaeota archaeon]RCH74399.1 MAG: hypothetical protein DBX05_01585 [Candidatus Poseidoniales archaeon]|tara:strand:- start:4825 stop:6315 length:1491 start_codon:yes stop_codon:yes gene_type:complete